MWRQQIHSFADAFHPERNAFGFLRLLLAALVLLAHCFLLGGFGTEPVTLITGGRHSLGTLAVGMFFVLSGFLVTRSVTRAKSIWRFLWHRFVRIFPGYWVCLLVCAFVLAPLMTLQSGGDLHELFSVKRGSPQSYVTNHPFILSFDEISLWRQLSISSAPISGLFSDNPYPGVVNGSLWTLPFELLCYLGLGGLLVARLLRFKVIVLVVFITLWALYSFSCFDPNAFAGRFSLRGFLLILPLLFYFCAGAVAFLYAAEIPASRLLFAAAGCVVVGGLLAPILAGTAPIAIAYMLLCVAFKLPLERFDANGDFSYGTYIYAFPVQQCLAQLGVHELGLTIYVLSCLLATAGCAVVSYRWVEAPSMRWKNIDVAASLRTFRDFAGFNRHVAGTPIPSE